MCYKGHGINPQIVEQSVLTHICDQVVCLSVRCYVGEKRCCVATVLNVKDRFTQIFPLFLISAWQPWNVNKRRTLMLPSLWNLLQSTWETLSAFPVWHCLGFDIKELLQSCLYKHCRSRRWVSSQGGSACSFLTHIWVRGVYQQQTVKHFNSRVHLTQPAIIHLRLKYNAFPSSAGRFNLTAPP